MKKVLFIDRDGTLILETANFKIEHPEEIAFYPGMMEWLRKIAEELSYELVLVTNQDGLGTPDFPDEPFFTTHRLIMKTLAENGIHFSAEHIDRTYPWENQDTRKPGTGMLKSYFSPEYNLADSFVIGDRITDVMLAKNLGCRCFWLNDGRNLGAGEIKEDAAALSPSIALETLSWQAIYDFLKNS
ncbi:MAG: HAD-IIIA family hydrolase [Chitinophagales bacterium]